MYARAAFPQIGSYATFSPYIATESTRALMAPLKGWSGVSWDATKALAATAHGESAENLLPADRERIAPSMAAPSDVSSEPPTLYDDLEKKRVYKTNLLWP